MACELLLDNKMIVILARNPLSTVDCKELGFAFQSTEVCSTKDKFQHEG